MIKCAVVGVGYLGRFHAQKYKNLGNVELIAVVDRSQERAEQVGAEVGVPALSDYRELKRLGVQAVSIASDTSTHFEIAKWALENDIDVLVEKPITVTAAEARELIDIAKARQRILQVGLLERFNPAFLEAKKYLTKPVFFEARRIAQFTGRGHDVDVIRDLMIHDIDIIAHLVDRPLLKVEAVGVPILTSSVDIANARLEFEGGAVANVTVSRAAFKTERTIRMFQPNVYVVVDFGKKTLKINVKTGEIDQRGFPQIHMEEHQVAERDALQDEIASFVSCVEARSTPEVTGEDGLRALDIADEIYRSIVSRLDGPTAELILNSAGAA